MCGPLALMGGQRALMWVQMWGTPVLHKDAECYPLNQCVTHVCTVLDNRTACYTTEHVIKQQNTMLHIKCLANVPPHASSQTVFTGT